MLTAVSLSVCLSARFLGGTLLAAADKGNL